MSAILTEAQIEQLVRNYYPEYDPESIIIDEPYVYIKKYGSNVSVPILISDFFKLPAIIVPVSTYSYPSYPYQGYPYQTYYGNSRPGQWANPWYNPSINPTPNQNPFNNSAINSTLTNQNFGNQNFSQGYVSAPVLRK